MVQPIIITSKPLIKVSNVPKYELIEENTIESNLSHLEALNKAKQLNKSKVNPKLRYSIRNI